MRRRECLFPRLPLRGISPPPFVRPVAVVLRSDRCKPSAHPRTRVPCELPRAPVCCCISAAPTGASADYRFHAQPPVWCQNSTCRCVVPHSVFPRHVRQPCLQDLLLTRKTMTSQFLVELMPRTANLLQFTSGTCSAANDIIRLEPSPLIGQQDVLVDGTIPCRLGVHYKIQTETHHHHLKYLIITASGRCRSFKSTRGPASHLKGLTPASFVIRKIPS